MKINKNLFLENTIPQISEKIISNEITNTDIFNVVSNNYKLHEPSTRAWTFFDTEEIQLSKKNGILNNIPFGVKDIFNTEKMPTEMGSPIWKNYMPNNNARAVDSLILKGAVPVGKTVTAEFAVHYLNKTLNPHDKNRTPGTSSSGSAAAVAVGMVPFALGSQTAGSIIRPSSFCGIWGMKPSFGLIPRTGILKTTDSLDTIGFLTSHGGNLKILLDALRVRGPNYPFVYENIDKKIYKKNDKVKVGFVKTHTWANSERYTQEKLIELVDQISKIDHYEVYEINWPYKFEQTHEVHSTIYNKSLAYYFKNEIKIKNQISDIMQEIVEASEMISIDDFQNALLRQEYFCKELEEVFKPYDAIISLSTSSSAPLRNEVENDDPSLIWTLGHIPSINIPIAKCPKSLPFGLQFVAKKWDDFKLINIIEELIEHSILPSGSMKIHK